MVKTFVSFLPKAVRERTFAMVPKIKERIRQALIRWLGMQSHGDVEAIFSMYIHEHDQFILEQAGEPDFVATVLKLSQRVDKLEAALAEKEQSDDAKKEALIE